MQQLSMLIWEIYIDANFFAQAIPNENCLKNSGKKWLNLEIISVNKAQPNLNRIDKLVRLVA